MLMDAVISGRAGKALLISDGSLMSYDLGDPARCLPIQEHELHHFFGDAPDLRLLEDVSEESAVRVLDHEYRCATALDLILISLDPELSESARTGALEAVEGLLSDGRVAERLENYLYARAFPPAADPAGAIRYGTALRAVKVRDMLQRLQERQQAIREICLAWEAVPTYEYGDHGREKVFQDLVIQGGLFRTLALTRNVSEVAGESDPAEVFAHLIEAVRNYEDNGLQWAATLLAGEVSESPTLNAQIERTIDIQPANESNMRVPAAEEDISRETATRHEYGVSNTTAISTTSLSLDAALGVGGIPRGRIVEIYGPESSGKTTIALHVVSEAQKWGGVAAYIDAEHAMDAEYAAKLGVNTDELLISQPDSGEQALEIAEALVRSNGVDVIVVDSVAALIPRTELDGERGDSQAGLQARLMSQALRKLTAIVGQSNTSLIFINQIREKIGVMFGSPETTTGGRALKFYSSVRIDIRRIGAIKDGDRVVGNRTKVKIVKNKVAPPFRECEFDIMYGEGISREGDVLDLAVANRVVERTRNWYHYKGERLGQERDAAVQALKKHPKLFDLLTSEVRSVLGIYPIELPKLGVRGIPGTLNKRDRDARDLATNTFWVKKDARSN
jgi:recombination protein RecA